jgi:hypothetical protein
MRKILSSRQTFIMKYVFSAFWIIMFGLGTLSIWGDDAAFAEPEHNPFPLPVRWVFLLGWIVGTVLIYALVGRLKRVATDGTTLWISNYLREIEIPLGDVVDISENRWTNPRQVIVRMRYDRGFGERIRFMPRSRWVLPWREHPDVTELRAHVRAAGGMP